MLPSSWCPALAASALLLAGCAQQPTGTAAAPEADADPAALRNVDWQLQTLDTAGATRDVSEVDATLRVDDDDTVTTHACNYTGGHGTLDATTLQVPQMSSTLIGCSGLGGELDDVTRTVLAAGAGWRIEAGLLSLTADGTTLTYRERPSPWAVPEATPLVEGTVGEAVYRLSWQHHPESGAVGVSWESRDEPGVPMGTSGIGRADDEVITHLDTSGVSVAGRGFVFVAAPLDVERVEWQGPAGTVELTAHRLPPARTWQVFAGFVAGPTLGGQAVGYADGTEPMRSRVLPY